MRTNTVGAAHPSAAGTHFGRALTPGRTDGLGERFATTDNLGSAVELLRFRDDLASAPGFEEAIRERVSRLAAFDHPGFARVHELVHDTDHLTLVAAPASGRRLSEIISTPLQQGVRPAFVARLLREALHALAALETRAGATHAALTTDRVVVSKDGGVSLTEYVVGPGLEQLALWPEELWLQFGLLAPADDNGHALFDGRTTVLQLASIALSVLLGRQVSLQDFEHRLPALLEEVRTLAASAPSALAAPVNAWLDRALLNADGYASATDAEVGFRLLLAAAGPVAAAELDSASFPPSAARARVRTDQRDEPVMSAQAVVPTQPSAERVGRQGRYATWVAAALGILAIGEALVIAQLWTQKPTLVPVESSVIIESPQSGDTVMVDGKAVGATPLQLRVGPNTHAIRLLPAQPAIVEVPSGAAPVPPSDADRTAAALAQAAARQRSGGVSFSTPFELKVFEGDRVLGSTTDGPIVAAAGTHQLDLVNTALGYRARQIVTIRAGVITPLSITPPMGRISINAQPWAQVLIDNRPVGETPLANIPAALGEHEIVFRHPQLGERREKVTVRADAPARVSTSFQRQ